jgi:hypothetical protein
MFMRMKAMSTLRGVDEYTPSVGLGVIFVADDDGNAWLSYFPTWDAVR